MTYTLQQKIIDNIIVFMLIMSTGGLLFVHNRNIMSVIFLLLLIAVILFGKPLKKNFLYSSLLTLIAIFFLGGINYYYAVVEQTTEKYLFYLLSIVLSIGTLFHFKNNRNKTLIRSLYSVFYIISIHAAVNFLMYFLVQKNLHTISSTYNECETFLNLFFYTPDRGLANVFGLEFCRNQGLFWEPGVLQIFLNIFFFIEAFIFKRNKLLLLFLSFVILTTYSTTGLALLLIQCIFYVKQEFKYNKFILPLFLVILIPIFFVFSINIDEKLQGSRESSFQKRVFDLTQPVFIALDNPLTGIGLDLFQFQKIRQEFYISSTSLKELNSFFGIDAKMEVSDKGSSNSIMFLLASTGFPTAIFLLLMFFKQQIFVEKKWLIMLLMTISVMSEPLLLRPFFLIFIISGLFHYFYRVISFNKPLL